MEAVLQEGYALEYAKLFQNDKEIVLVAVNQEGGSLEFASEDLKNDKEVVMAAVEQDGLSLEYAGDLMKDNLEVVNKAI